MLLYLEALETQGPVPAPADKTALSLPLPSVATPMPTMADPTHHRSVPDPQPPHSDCRAVPHRWLWPPRCRPRLAGRARCCWCSAGLRLNFNRGKSTQCFEHCLKTWPISRAPSCRCRRCSGSHWKLLWVPNQTCWCVGCFVGAGRMCTEHEPGRSWHQQLSLLFNSASNLPFCVC